MAHPGGRPTDYRPEFCEIVIEKMKVGAAIKELPFYLDVCLDTINEWRKVHPQFSAAIKTGQSYSEAVWMIQGRENIPNKEFNSTLWYMNMKNRFGWKDNKETTHGISDGSLMQKVIDKL